VGTYSDASGGGAFLYDAGVFTPIEVPFPGADSTVVLGLNNRGHLVGSYQLPPGYHGFVYADGAFIPLDAPGASGLTQAVGINDADQVVGIYGVNPGGTNVHSFVYQDGRFTPLDADGASETWVVGINNRGQILGHYTDESGSHGFLYDVGVFTLLDTLGAFAGKNAFGLNNRG
jgi:probable HAF family extracellular repeat protein